MTGRPLLQSDFPPGTRFYIKEFGVPLTRAPGQGWVNWFGGVARACDPALLRPGNHWPADSFEEWAQAVAESS